MDLSIFTSHKDSIRHWVESFVVIHLRGEQSWGFDNAWGDINTECSIFPHLSKWKKLYFACLTSLPYKYDVFKCLQLPLGGDCYAASKSRPIFSTYALLPFLLNSLLILQFPPSLWTKSQCPWIFLYYETASSRPVSNLLLEKWSLCMSYWV